MKNEFAFQYITAVLIAAIAWRDLGPTCGIAAFLLAIAAWNYLRETEITRGNRQFEQRQRHRRP